jgi:hypothetical protein
MVFAPGPSRGFSVLVSAVRRHDDDPDMFVELCPKPSGDFMAVKAGEAEIYENNFGTKASRQVYGGVAVGGELDLMTQLRHQPGEAVYRVEIVFNYQDPSLTRIAWLVGMH